jgi:hypothetical protein
VLFADAAAGEREACLAFAEAHRDAARDAFDRRLAKSEAVGILLGIYGRHP